MNIRPSELFPTLQIVKNEEERFITEYDIPNGYKTIGPGHQLNSLYLTATLRLLPEIKEGLKNSSLWICQNTSASSNIFVYFTQPPSYMITSCCSACVFLKFDFNLSGAICCSKCQMSCYLFVHCNFSSHLEKQSPMNERIFKECKENIETNKQSIRKLISCQKYRHKKLKNFLTMHKDESSIQVAQSAQKKCKIGEFIVQISLEAKQMHDFKAFQVAKKEGEVRGRGIDLSETQEELKKIISDIFG